MKVLQLASKPPYPQIDGGCIAVASLANGLLEKRVELYSYSIYTEKHPFDLHDFPINWQEKVHPVGIFVDTSIRITGAFLNLFSSKSYFTARFYSKAFEQKLIELLKKEVFDIIQLESVYLFSYFEVIKQHSNAKIIFRTHNIEHQLILQRASDSSFLKHQYLKLQANRLKKEECFLAKNCDGIVAISQQEADFFQPYSKTNKIIHIPTGIAVQENEFAPKTEFFHIGAMDWQPNKEGIEWFLKNVWKDFPEKTQLHLAGKSLSESIHHDYENVINHREVKQAAKFMQAHGIMVVPLFSGSGIRIKIIEAGALGIPIIATKKAVEGIEITKDVDYLEANTQEEFTSSMKLLLKDVDLQEKLSKSIKKQIALHYNPEKLAQKLVEFYQSI